MLYITIILYSLLFCVYLIDYLFVGIETIVFDCIVKMYAKVDKAAFLGYSRTLPYICNGHAFVTIRFRTTNILDERSMMWR